MHRGTIDIIYIGDDTGDMNLRVNTVTTEVSIEALDSTSVKLIFNLHIEGLANQKLLEFIIRDYAAFADPARLFIDDVIKIDVDDYVLTGLMLYNTDNSLEQFRVIGRFSEGIPSGLLFHSSPMKNMQINISHE